MCVMSKKCGNEMYQANQKIQYLMSIIMKMTQCLNDNNDKQWNKLNVSQCQWKYNLININEIYQ